MFSPLFLTNFLDIFTSSASKCKILVELSNVNSTRAKSASFKSLDPAKIKFDFSLPRKLLIDCSPIAHFRASTIFDLPEPFGPTIPIIVLLKFNVTGLAKDLKPSAWNFFKKTIIIPKFKIILKLLN